MIFYFSGTGNSQFIAKQISQEQQEELIAISMACKNKQFEYDLKQNEKVIFVFPIYHCTVPSIVIDFIDKLTFKNQLPSYLTVIVTYGQRVGNTNKFILKKFESKNWQMHSFYTIKMPDNRWRKPKKEVDIRLIIAKEKVMTVNKNLLQRKQEYEDVKKNNPSLMPVITYFITQSYDRNVKTFFANEDCISCKICEKVCPINCITVDRKPKWTKKCTKCLACLNYCPKSAIQFKNWRNSNYRYTHPAILWYQLNQD